MYIRNCPRLWTGQAYYSKADPKTAGAYDRQEGVARTGAETQTIKLDKRGRTGYKTDLCIHIDEGLPLLVCFYFRPEIYCFPSFFNIAASSTVLMNG